jgi:hypothetical protein
LLVERTNHSSKYVAALLSGALAVIIIFSIIALDSFAQTDLTTTTTTTGSTQDQGSNATSATTASLREPFFVEQGRITGQRVLAVAPQPQLESSFMANASINNGSGFAINALNLGTTISTLNADGTFSGKGQGILRTEGGGFASWTSQSVGSLTPDGSIVTRGVTFWSIPPSTTTGELAFMNGVIGLFEFQLDRQGNLSVTEWEWESGIGNNADIVALQEESPMNTTTS